MAKPLTFLQKYLPTINFIIGTTALTFQMTVLYPWHHQLDADFTDLKNQQAKKLEEYHQLKLNRLAIIEQNTVQLMKYLEQKDGPSGGAKH